MIPKKNRVILKPIINGNSKKVYIRSQLKIKLSWWTRHDGEDPFVQYQYFIFMHSFSSPIPIQG